MSGDRRGGGKLNERQIETLGLVFETLFAAYEPQPVDEPRLARLSARDVEMIPYALSLIARLEPESRRDLGRLLRLLETPAATLAMVGIAKPFGAMSARERERTLRRLARHRLPVFRQGFQGLKRMASVIFYALADSEGDNPTWDPIGYQALSATPAQTDRLLRLTSFDGPNSIEADVCIVGSGAGGGVVAAELAAAGKRVVVLEAGSGYQAPDFVQQELSGIRSLYLDHGLTASDDLGVVVIAGSALGGATTFNWQVALRLPDDIREQWAAVSGLPFLLDGRFDASIDAVARRIGASTNETYVNRNGAVIARGAEALGYSHGIVPRNATGCVADECGYCVFGCRRGAKQGTAVTFLHDAQSSGRDTIIVPNCQAERIVIENGKAIEIEATATDPQSGATFPLCVRAERFVVSGGALLTPVLLLRSGLEHPQIGKSLFLHPTTWLIGQYPDRVEPWIGPPITTYCDEFARLDGTYGFILESVPAHPGAMAMAMPWFGSRSHRRLMARAGHSAVFIALVRDREGGRVRVSSTGRPRIEYRPGKQEQAHLRRGMVEGARLQLAAGADTVITMATSRPAIFSRTPATTRSEIDVFLNALERWPVNANHSMIGSAHQMGTCAMGAEAKKAPCDGEGRLRGVANLYVADASLFPASSGVNPMLTVMALAQHVAQAVKASWS